LEQEDQLHLTRVTTQIKIKLTFLAHHVFTVSQQNHAPVLSLTSKK